MPGFAIPTDSGTIGSHGIEVPSNAQYYYNYTWQIFELVGYPFAYSDYTALVHLKDATLPTFTANQDTYLGSSLEYKWAKSVTWDDIKVVWYDTAGLAKIMQEWRQNIWDEKNGLKTAEQYKKRSQIDVYLPNGDGVVTWCLVGSWPRVIKQGELTYTDSNVKLVEVTVVYDWAVENYGGVSKDSAAANAIDRVKYSCGGDLSRYTSREQSAHQPNWGPAP